MRKALFDNKRLRTARRIIKIVLTAIFAALWVTAIVFFINEASGRPIMLFGHAVLRTSTASMEPTIPAGSYILVESVLPEDVRKDDIITFYSDDPEIYGLLNTHRVMEEPIISEAYEYEYITKGDAGFGNDEYHAKGEKLFGRFVRTIPELDFISQLVTGQTIFVVCLVMVGLYILMFAIRLVIACVKKSEYEKQKEILIQKAIDEYVKSSEK